MKNRGIYAGVAVLLAAALTGGCAGKNTAGTLAPSETAAPELEDGDWRVELEGNPTTGYTWLYRMEPEGIVSEKASGFYQNYHESGLVGAGGTFVFDFTGEQEGTAEVIFTYSRPWESKQAEQTKVYQMTVDQDGYVMGEEVRENVQ